MNFLTRTVTAIVFASVMLFCMLKGAAWFVGLFALITVLSTIEYTGLANKHKDANTSRLWATVAAFTFYAAIVGLSAGQGTAILFLPFVFTLMVIMIRELYFKKPSPINDWVHTLFPVIYIALPFALTSLLAFDAQGPDSGYSPVIPLTLFVFLWCNDVGAYCTGCTIGKHKLFERISPKKTWEGSIGGAVLTMVAAFLLHKFLPDWYSFMPVWVWIGMALVVVVFGTWGDLIESLMKREMGIKDSGKILPGHGGMLDRFDSALLAIPATVVYLSLVGFYF
ncbi:MAG: phosphatidate cytidylyltransferase [Bacteroidaceae bacterium]|jgi:phosphatidate cytidylyltransferase|nr:phosphatidate cytidylyltransferase [Bacteroidaceae bacterium]